MNKTYSLLGAIAICFGIVIGAFGAHGLKESLNISELASFEVGVRYQIYHGLAMLILGINAKKVGLNSYCIWGFSIGTILFSFSIYLLSADRALGVDLSFIGPITPIGGGTLILSWFYLIVQIAKSKGNS